jgi:hypothetical protein
LVLNPNLVFDEAYIEVVNAGNAGMIVLVDALISPPGCGLHATIPALGEKGILTILPGHSELVAISIQSSPSGVDPDIDVKGKLLMAIHQIDGTTYWNGTVAFTMVAPDLLVESVKVLNRAEPGGLVEATVRVSNKGDGASPPTIIIVKGSNDEWEPTFELPALSPGQNVSVHISFRIWSGKATYQFALDPENDIWETGNAPNSQILEIASQDEEEQSDGRGPLLVMAVLLVLVVLAAVIWFLMVRRNKSR